MIWKLLRQHLSALQLLGFFVANLMGILIVLLSFQFYRDVRPIFSQEDGVIRNDFLIVSKRVGSLGFMSPTFSKSEIRDLEQQPFAKSVGAFTASQYKVSCSAGIDGIASFGTQMYFESVPDAFVDANSSQWHFKPGDNVVPIVLPRSYLAIYNFGFAQSHQLPKISEGVISMIDMVVVLRGAGREARLQGKVVGFTNRLQTILVPESFIQWSNQEFAPDADTSPTRMIVEVGNPTDERITQYAKSHGYEIDEDKLQAGKATYFLKIASAVVMLVGLIICLLSIFILMLSIYLLVQKNTHKLQNLLLIGYSPWRVSLPYQTLTIFMNLLVFLFTWGILLFVRGYYLDLLWAIFPTLKESSTIPTVVLGLVLLTAVSAFNAVAISRKITAINRPNKN